MWNSDLLEDNPDVFLTAAAVGDVQFIKQHFARFFQSPVMKPAKKLFRRMKRLAREHGCQELVSWLETQRWVIAGEQNEAMEEINTISTDLIQLQFSPSTSPPSSPTHSMVDTTNATAVLTNRSLLERIGSFQPDPSAFVNEYKKQVVGDAAKIDCLPGVLVHHAIIHGDLYALQMLYTARLLYPEVATKPEVSFSLAMHLAACEGRLSLLQWLYARCQRHPTLCNLCPDTLAMAVRCGWADIVEWLHWTLPACGRTLSEYAVNDAAHWGHVDVLRVCHRYKLGEFTDRTMVSAARAGHLEVVQVLRSLEGLALSTETAMDVAIACGHVAIVEYFQEECRERVDARRLTIGLRSTAATADPMIELLWTHVYHDTEARKRAALQSFQVFCSERSDQIVALVLPFVVDHPPTLLSGLDAAVKAMRLPTVRLLLPVCCNGATNSKTVVRDHLLELLSFALQRKNAELASLLIEAGEFSARALGSIFRTVVQHAGRDDVGILVDLHLDEFCEDAFVAVAQAGNLELLERLYSSRTKAAAIEALRVAKNVETAQFLLVNEDEFYTERIVLDNAPLCIEPKLIRLLVYDGHQTDMDAVASFAGIQYKSYAYLELHELKSIHAANDPVVNARLASRHASLLSLEIVSQILDSGMHDLIDFVHNKLALTELTTAELNSLLATERLDHAQELLNAGVRDVSMATILQILQKSRMHVVQLLFGQHDFTIDAQFLNVVAVALQQPRIEDGGVRSTARDNYGWTLSLLQLFVQQRPRLHARLLELVAAAGLVSAVSYMLNPRSGVDTTKLAMLPSILAAARGSHHDVVELLFRTKREDEVVDVGRLRVQLSSVSDAGALQLLLQVLSRLEPSVQAELDDERKAASALFGMGALGGSATGSVVHKRKATGRAKPGRRW